MAVRLAVVMVHTPPASASARELAESIVGELIGLAEVDLTLVGPLDRLGADSTDRLTLDAIAGDVAVLDWRDAEEIVRLLGELGMVGSRSPHRFDPQVAASAGGVRKIYAVDLRGVPAVADLLDGIMQLKSSAQIKTFALGLGAAAPKSKPSSVRNPAAGATDSAATHDGSPASSPPQLSGPHVTEETGKIDLDRLIDHLDEIDP